MLGLTFEHRFLIRKRGIVNEFLPKDCKQEAPLTPRGQRGRCRNIKENPKYLGASLAQGHAHFFL